MYVVSFPLPEPGLLQFPGGCRFSFPDFWPIDLVFIRQQTGDGNIKKVWVTQPFAAVGECKFHRLDLRMHARGAVEPVSQT